MDRQLSMVRAEMHQKWLWCTYGATKSQNMKRRHDQEWLPAKRHKVETPVETPCLKRSGTFELLTAPKRRRTEEGGALHRQLAEAYARIEFLENKIRELEYVAALSREKNYPAYNHMIECH